MNDIQERWRAHQIR